MGDLWQKITDCWQVKMFWAGFISCLTFLIGDITATPFIALWCLVVLDTITRWMALAKQENDATGHENGSIIKGFGAAVICSRINSETFRIKFTNKAASYIVLLIGFNLLDMVIPDVMFGYNFVGFPNAFISTWLAIGEIKSILENLIAAGIQGLSPLVCWAEKRREQMTDTQQQNYGWQPGRLPNQYGTPVKSDGRQPPV